MHFKAFSYTKKNRFDYPAWVIFITFALGSNLKRQLKGSLKNMKVRFLILSFCPRVAIMLGRRSYYTWDENKYSNDMR